MTVSASAQQAEDGRARSLALFKESAVHYEAGRYSVAAALLEEAYALHPEPKLLYNLGRAREAGGEVKGALQAYETYLQMDPASAKRPEVEGRIAELRARAVSEPAAVDEPAATQPGTAGAPSSRTETAQTSPAEQEAPVARRTVPWVLVGAGGGILAAALTVGILARAQAKDAEREPSQAEAAKLQSSAERKALAANVLGGAGGALLIAGGAWLVFGGRAQAKEQHGKNLSWSLNVGASNVDCLLRF